MAGAELATALFSLAVASSPNHDQVRTVLKEAFGTWDLLPPDQALKVLAERFSEIPQAVTLDSLARLASVRGDELFADPQSPASEQLNRVLLQLVPAPGHPLPPDIVEVARAALLQLIGLPPQEATTVVYEQIGTTLGYEGALWTVPLCADDTIVAHNVQCNRIHATFWTSRTVEEMADYVDPRNWPTCSAYFGAMTEVSLQPPAGGDHWTGVFDETIQGIPSSTGGPMINRLKFTYDVTRDANNAMTLVQNTYKLVHKTPDLDVDEGYMFVKKRPDPGNGMTTYVEMEKVVHFVNPTILQVWPDFPCATFWGELALDTAASCSSTISLQHHHH